MDKEGEELFFIRVGVWGRVQGRPERVAEFVGGPLRSHPGDIRGRAALGMGQESASPYQTEASLAPHFEGKEISAAVTLDFDLDALGGARGGRMACFADLWGRGLSQAFNAPFIRALEETRDDAPRAWGLLLAESEKAQLGQAAEPGESGAGARPGRRI